MSGFPCISLEPVVGPSGIGKVYTPGGNGLLMASAVLSWVSLLLEKTSLGQCPSVFARPVRKWRWLVVKVLPSWEHGYFLC